MNKRNEHERLLADLATDGWTSGKPAGYANAAAAYARGRRRNRKILVGGATCTLLTLALVLLSERQSPVMSRAVLQPTPTIPAYEVISDSELFTQLRERPVLMVDRADGHRDLVFLDR